MDYVMKIMSIGARSSMIPKNKTKNNDNEKHETKVQSSQT